MGNGRQKVVPCNLRPGRNDVNDRRMEAEENQITGARYLIDSNEIEVDEISSNGHS